MERKQERELSGTKEHIKIMAQLVRPIRTSSYPNIPVHLQRHLKECKVFLSVITVKVDDIDTYEKLGFVIAKWFGPGTFNLLFYNRHQRNKKFKRNFTCLIQRNMECPKKQQCRIYSRHKKGYACKMNPKLWPNWAKRAQVTVTPINSFLTTKEYETKFNRRCDKLFYFKKWFFKGKGDRR